MRNVKSAFTLIEVMIAMTIFAISALGLAQLQISVVKQRIHAKRYAQAMFYAEELLETAIFTPFDSVNQTGLVNDIPLTVSDSAMYERSLTTDSGATIKKVTVTVKWKDANGNFLNKNSLNISTQIWSRE